MPQTVGSNSACCVMLSSVHCVQVATSKIDEYARGMISGSGSTLFEELGLYYIGPVDGHNIDDLVTGKGDRWASRCCPAPCACS